MDTLEELTHMRQALNEHILMQGYANTPAQERLRERELTIVRLFYGFEQPSKQTMPQLEPEFFEGDRLSFTPFGYSDPFDVQYLNINETGFCIAPEIADSHGNIHVPVPQTAYVGFIFIRPRSPKLFEKEHTSRRIAIDRESTVYDQPLVTGQPLSKYPIIGGDNPLHDVVEGTIQITGTGVLGRPEFIIVNKSTEYPRRPDVELILRGAVLPANQEPGYKPSPYAAALEAVAEYAGKKDVLGLSINPKDRYSLKYIFN